MQVSVEKISNVERRLTIVVDAQELQEAYRKNLNKIAQTAKIKGFRPGKIPMNFIESRFGEEAKNEAVNEVIQKSYYQAIQSEKLVPVSSPKVSPKKITLDEPLEYSVFFEVLPEIGAININLSNVEKPLVEVTENDIDRVIQQIQKQHTKWNVVEREANEKDRLIIDYYAIFAGKSDIENKVTDFSLELGSGTMLPGFESGLIGAKTAEQKKLNLKFPDEFSVPERAGKPVEFIVDVKQILEASVPPIEEEFIKKLGVTEGTIDALKKDIRNSLEQERDSSVRNKLKEQIFAQLVQLNPLEIPQSLIDQEANNVHDEIYKQQTHNHNEHTEEELASYKDVAKKRVHLSILLSEYAKQNNIKPDDKLVNERINAIAASYEQPKEIIAWLSSKEVRGGLESQVLEDQLVEKLLLDIPLTEKTMSYAELKGIRI